MIESDPGPNGRTAPSTYTLRIFHISDLHARGARDGKRAYKHKIVLGDAWRRNLDELSKDGRAFDLVVFTGDVADFGLPEEYEDATPFLMEILDRLHVSAERLFVVPGNHDVNRKTEVDAWAKLRKGIAVQDQDVSEWLAGIRDEPPFGFNPASRDAILRREQAFWSWVERDLDRGELLPGRSHHGRLGYSVDVPGMSVPVRVIGLDSAWLSGNDADAGKLWLTEDQLGLLCRDPKGKLWPGFRLALVHHPLSDLADDATANRYLGDSIDLVLRGHQHVPLAGEHASPDRVMRELAAGCLFEGSRANRHANGCHVIDALLDGSGRPLRYDIRFRSWSVHGHWYDDGAIYREARNGRLTWEIPGPGAKTITPASMDHEPAVTDLRRRYLEAIERAEANRDTLAAIITSASAPGGVVPLDDVYLPPRLHRMFAAAVELAASDPELASDDPDAPGRPLQDWLDAATQEQKLFVVSGEMGSGKTELMRHRRRELARMARNEPTAPLPIFMRARDLDTETMERESLASAASKQLKMQGDTLRALLADPATRWIYLIDGLDEASSAVWEAVRALAGEPECRAASVVVTSRPAAIPLGAGDVLLSLPRWNDAQVEFFLNRWRALDASAVTALQESPHYRDARGELLANPLTATLCLAIVRQRGSLPPSRAALFVEIIETLFQDWARERGGNPIEWQKIALAIERVALDHVRERHAHVARDRLKQELRLISIHGVQELERATDRCFGVLVALEDGSGYEFLFRGLAEHLAGAALLQPDQPGDVQTAVQRVVAAAYEPWAEEVVRHAVGIAMERNRRAESLDMLQLLIEAGRPRRDCANQRLRPLLIAIRTAADLQEKVGGCARRLLVAAFVCLLEEESYWVGDRVADAVQVLAAAGGPLTKALWRCCHHRLMESEHEPAAWYAAQRERPAKWWLRALRHRDASVRAIACERLAAHVDDHEVREELGLMLLDAEGIILSPALMAGAALRKATRDTHFEGIREALVSILAYGGQLSAGGAALALRPDEAEPRALARALAIAYEGTREILAAPVYELEAAPGGREALDAEWPAWREGLVETWQRLTMMVTPMAADQLTKHRPVSHHVRRRMIRAFATGFHHLDATEVDAAQARHMDGSIEELCRAIYYRPATLLPRLRLNEYNGPLIPVDAQRELGRAAAKHTLVRDALLAAWEQNPEARRRRNPYPGVALEPLVLRRDEEAIAVYAAWLPESPYTWPFAAPSPDRAVFEIATIKEAALAGARYTWDYATRGRMEKDGERRTLAPLTTSIELHHRWPAWIDDTTLVDEIARWLDDDDSEKRTAAIWAFAGGPLNGDVRSLVEQALIGCIRRYIDSPDISAYDVRSWLLAVELLGFEELSPLLAKMASLGTDASPLAAAVLLPSLTKQEAQALAGGIAAAGILPGSYILGTHHLRALVQAAPEAWLALVTHEAEGGESPDEEGESPNLSLAARLLPHLPAPQREALARVLYQADTAWELPWQQVSDEGGRLMYARPADVVERVLFEAGHLIKEDAPEPATP